MKRITFLILALCIAMPLASNAGEIVYKWVDKNGVTHFSTHPPAGQKVEKVRIATGSSKGKSADSAPKAAEQPKQATQPPPKAAIEPASTKDPERCKQARTNLWNLQNHPRVRILDSDTGEQRMMTQEEREERIAESEKEIEKYCK